MDFEIPFLPISVNACWRSTQGGRVYKSKRYMQFLKDMDAFLETVEYDKLEGELIMNVDFFCRSKRKRDLDNLLKSLIDSLEGRLFENDNQIVEIHSKKFIGCNDDKTILSLVEKAI